MKKGWTTMLDNVAEEDSILFFDWEANAELQSMDYGNNSAVRDVTKSIHYARRNFCSQCWVEVI